MIVIAFFMGKALGITSAKLVNYFLFFPIIAVISALPISVGGLGVGEASFVYCFGIIGVPDGKAFALGISIRFLWILWGLLGGLFYILHGSPHVPEKVMEEELKHLEEESTETKEKETSSSSVPTPIQDQI